MATKKRKNSKIKIDAKWQKKLTKGGVGVLLVVVLVWFINSPFWPWPSSSEVGRRLNEVIDACIYNERSRGCSSMQERYGMAFEYCHSLTDIPEIGKRVPIYGVAKKNGTKTREISYRGGDKTLNKFPYYACASYLEDVDKNIDTDLLYSEPPTMALFALYKTPHYSTSGDNRQCRVTLDPGYSFLWDQIPNIATIKNDYEVAFKAHKSCGQLSELQNELNIINAKLLSYSSDRAVQQFYKNYGDWAGDRVESNSVYHSTCHFMDKTFISQICGATIGPNSINNLDSFSSEMRSYVSTDDFTSKIVVTE